ncbi:MAG TPA: DegV family protein [Bacilli bacterium]|nr:MAG: DegV domain-containing protein [Tenericutes bacterium ADurb.BinA124]HNZ49886.1 DegV family protein [Bacilli bacterium]HOH17696.1 DegV family protein [Bacilli bacterium]HPN60839.1 DegV family protein [Bacilli bacterium]HPX84242.1 DegV family protein [Bacilli bacterium]
MQKIAVISDVNAGLDYLGYDPDIPVLRSIINFGEEHFIDGIDIKADAFYKKLQTSPIIPSTSAPTVGEAMTLLDKLISEGYTDVIMISISYQLSSIGQMVETLIDEYANKIKIHVIDSKSATYMQGYIAVEAKKMAVAGKPLEEILDYCHYLVENKHAYFVVDDLSYLVKNGRLSGAAGFIGSLLKVKPVLELTKEGKIVSKEKIRTHSKAVERALELFKNEIKDAKKVKIFVFHTVREQDAKILVNRLQKECKNAEEIELHMVTPAVGAHIGCGIIGMGYFILEK